MALEAVRFASPHVNRWFTRAFRSLLRPGESSRTTGSTYVLLSTAAAYTLFPQAIALTSVCFLAVGDAAAGWVGERWGRHPAWGKSLEGSTAFFLAALVVGASLAFATHLPLWLVAAGATAAAVVELLPLPVNDNLSVPLVSAALMALLAALV